MAEAARIVGLEAYNAKLKRLSDSIKRPRVLFKRTAAVLDRWSLRNFQQEGRMAMGGSGWAKLQESTIKQRRSGGKKGAGRRIRILQDTGRGRASIIVKANDKMAKIGTGLGYMIAHHKGTRRLPERRVIPEFRQVRKRVHRVLSRYLREEVRRSFGS